MLLTKESDYGIRTIRALATNEKKTVREICEAEHIPNQYAYKILKKLEHAGFVHSVRGRDGGYCLSKPLFSYTLFDVVAALDENFAVFECLREDSSCLFKNSEPTCTVHLEFIRLQMMLVDEMRKITMDKLLIKEPTHK